jgi:hypothetical protein
LEIKNGKWKEQFELPAFALPQIGNLPFFYSDNKVMSFSKLHIQASLLKIKKPFET